MIFDKIENLPIHFQALPPLEKVWKFIKDFEENGRADGTYEIDGRRIFAMVQSYETKAQTPEMTWEAHRKYIDMQYIAGGIEKIQWAPLDTMEMVEERYSQGGDIAFYRGKAVRNYILSRGTFLLLYPEDTHLPGLHAIRESSVRKIVFKIQTADF